MALSSIINNVVCGQDSVLGSGIKGCKPFFKKVVGFWLLPQGTTITADLTAVSAQALQVDSGMIVVKGIRTFTDNTPDDTIDELDDGTKDVARLGLYEFAVQFVNGLYYYLFTQSVSSFNNYDAVLIDIDGNLLGTRDASGNFKGFSVGMLQGSKLQWATDSTRQREGLMMQFLYRNEFDDSNKLAFIDAANLGSFNALDVEGVNEVVVSFPTAPAAGTSLTVTVKRKQDGGALSGLTFNDFLATKGGATSNPTADDSEATGAGTYVLTVPAFIADDVITARIYDNSGNSNVLASGGDLYKSNVATTIAV